MNQEQAKRLRDVARALREAPDPAQFDMGTFFHSCKSPACAAGHYALRPDLHGGRVTVKQQPGSKYDYPSHTVPEIDGYNWFYGAREYFGLTRAGVDELFYEGGCGMARTAAEAADYIEAFVARECPAP